MEENETNIIAFLLDWAENYFKSRDAFQKKIVSIIKSENSFLIEFKDKKERIISLPDLTSIQDSDIAQDTSIITLNNRKNVEYLYDKWAKFLNISSFKIYFINPLSNTDKKWVIAPCVHAKICDESSLRMGLMSMFETVEPLTKEILRARL